MGSKLLRLLLIFLFITQTFASDKIKEIDNIIEKIKTRRVGISKEAIKELKDPFFLSKKEKKLYENKKRVAKSKRVNFKLYAIFNNKAKINSKWYKIGNKIKGFTLYKVCNNCVKLKRNKRVVTLFLNKKSSKIKIYKN